MNKDIEKIFQMEGVQGRLCYIRLPDGMWSFIEKIVFANDNMDLNDKLSRIIAIALTEEVYQGLKEFNKLNNTSFTIKDVIKIIREI